jgi:hypothetical protein
VFTPLHIVHVHHTLYYPSGLTWRLSMARSSVHCCCCCGLADAPHLLLRLAHAGRG